MNVLIVEDDEALAKEIAYAAKSWDMQSYIARDFKNLVQEVRNRQPDILLLDINLPYFDGFYWCERIRRFSDIPILFISSRDQDQDKIMAMMSGGDDYLQKPFSLPLLMAKMQALLRRCYTYSVHTACILAENLVYDMEKGVLRYQKEEVELTKTENKILQILIRNKGRIVSREDLMMQIWSTDEFISDGTLTTGISRIKAKLRRYCDEELIVTKKKQGYMLL